MLYSCMMYDMNHVVIVNRFYCMMTACSVHINDEMQCNTVDESRDYPVIVNNHERLCILLWWFIREVSESESILAKQCENGSPCNINTSILEHPVYCYGNIHQSSVWVYAGQTVWGWMGEVYLLCLLSEQCNQAGSGTWDCLSVYHNYVSMVNKYH